MFVSVVVELDGTLTNFQVLKKVPFGCTEEAIRIIKLMDGQWEPGKVKGQAVTGKKTFGIKFTIPRNVPKPTKN